MARAGVWFPPVSPSTSPLAKLSPRVAADTLVRRTLPRALVAASQVTLPARLAAAAKRRRGEPERLELFFAFDDPCSAVATIDLSARLAGRPVEIVPLPVVERGIAGDPAVQQKREYAVIDARRLARRAGMTLARETPLPAADTAFLAEWVAAVKPSPALLAFTVAALRRLWFEGDGPVEREAFLGLWREHVGSEEARPDPAAVLATEKRMSRRGPYETPAAWVAGRWYFAHDRPGQICEWLDELGWTPR
jgi:2-hydroxychromene-2-carboxylate isomerase